MNLSNFVLFGAPMVLAIIILVIVIAVALGFGWVISWLIPVLSLFEGTVIVLLAIIIVANWLNTLATTDPPSDDDLDDRYVNTIHEIPISQFIKSAADETWEAYFQYEFANSIYEAIAAISPPTLAMNQHKLQELAIDLSQLTISLLQDRKTLPKQISVAMLRRHTTKHEPKQPYDDNILQVVVTVINHGLDYHREQLNHIVKHKLWHDKTTML